jgi:hypothetical protein
MPPDVPGRMRADAKRDDDPLVLHAITVPDLKASRAGGAYRTANRGTSRVRNEVAVGDDMVGLPIASSGTI